jgi:uncharacterized protein (DUF58 family)
MIYVPSLRLIWLVAIVAFPAAILHSFAILGALAIVIVADLFLRRDAVRVEMPGLIRAFKDRAGEIRIRAHCSSTRRVRIGIAAPESIESEDEEQTIDLPAGDSEFRWRYTPHRRGRYFIKECFVESATRLGLWNVRRRQALDCELRVYPNLRRASDLRALKRGAEGLHAVRQMGRGREFEKLREYIPGDGFDEIHWKATARRGRPVTKVFQIERTQEVYAVIDASRLAARSAGEETALERAITAGLILGAAAERRGDLFGLAAFSHQMEAFTRARNGKAHYAACRDAIYQLQPRQTSPDFEEIATFLRLRLRRRAMLLFLTSLDDPVLAENFSRATKLLASRHLVLAAMLRPASVGPLFEDERVNSADDIYRRLAGHLAWKRLKETEAALARQGVRLAVLDPENFGASLVALYDEVKQRQLL